MSINAFTLSYYVLFLAMVMVIIKICRTMPSKEIIKKYPRSTIAKSICVPFFESWKKDVEPDHMEVIERYAKSGRALIVALLVFIIISSIIRYLQVVYLLSVVEGLTVGE